MPLLFCHRADLHFALDSRGLVRVLSADEIAAHREQAFLSESLLPCDPAVLFDTTTALSTGQDLPPAAAAGLLFHHGDLQVLVSVDRIERQSPKDQWDLLPLPPTLRSASAGLFTRMACRRHAQGHDLVPLLHLAALWEEPDFSAKPPLTATRTRLSVSNRSTAPGLLHWPLVSGHSTRLAISLKQVYELTTTAPVVPLPGLPPTLRGVSLWHDRLISALDPGAVFLDDSLINSSSCQSTGAQADSFDHVDRRQRPHPGEVHATRPFGLVIACEQADEPLLLMLPSLPQRLRQTRGFTPQPLSTSAADALLHGRFHDDQGLLLVPAWDRVLTHALLAAPPLAPTSH